MRDYGDRAGRLPEALVGSEVTVARGLVNSRGRLANATVLNDTQFAWSGGDGGVWGSSQDDGLGSGGVWRIGVWDDPEPAVEGRNLASKNLCSEGKEAQEKVARGTEKVLHQVELEHVTEQPKSA